VADFIIKCEVCDSLIDEEDLFCANCGTEAPQRDRPERVHDTARQATCNFECSGCGASMSYDAGAGSLRCPFCGSVDLREQKDAKILAPSKVVPFAVSRDAADAAMRQWLGNGFFRPGDLAREAAVVKMTPVFVPYWIFHAKTHTYWTADTSQTPAGASADWYPMSGEHHGSYSNLLIGASGALAPGETSAAIEHLEAQACDAAYIPGRARNIHANVRIESMSSEPVLLPVWIMAYRYQDRVFRFLVNGQTGRATGQAPTSWAKVLGIAALVVAAILVILACMGVFGAVLAAVGRNDRPGLGAALTFSSFRDFAAKPRKDEIAWMPWMPCPRRPVSTPPAEHGSPGGARNGPHRFPENAHKRLTEP